MTYSESIQFLYDLRLFGAKLGLENTLRLAELSGNPEERLRFIHVAGTNGKGSTCAILESIYRAAGLRVGLYTSPHLVSFCERIQVNREWISENAVVQLLQRLRPLLEQFPLDHHPTFFEVVTIMALLYFAEQGCELVIWETGMGGRLDATNIVTPIASVITNVTSDHQRWLGETVEQIAAEKAGIIKPRVPVITAADGVALSVIRDVATQENCDVTVARAEALPDIQLSLMGEFQRMNAAVALATVERLRSEFPVSNDAIRQGLAGVHWAGRMQEVRLSSERRILLDGAHNLAGVRALVCELQRLGACVRPTLLFGVLEDKDWKGMIDLLAPVIGRVVFVPVQSARGLDPEQLVLFSRKTHHGLAAEYAPTLRDALRTTESEPFILITGSLYLVGEAMELLHFGPESARSERVLNEWAVSGR